MQLRRSISLALVGASLATAMAVPAASASTPTIYGILGAQGAIDDGNWYDFDILAKAATTVITVKGAANTDVDALDGPGAFTVFAPNDRAFQVLAYSVTGRWYSTETAVFNALAGLGVNTIERVLRYHVVPGAVVDYATAKTITTPITTLEGGTIKPRYVGWLNTLFLGDKDPNAFDPWVTSRRDIRASNGIIHGISLVLRPFDI